MDSRQRFLASLSGGKVDHPPLFPEGIRDGVLCAWQAQGMPAERRLDELFYYDDFEELDPDVYPLPEIEDWSDKRNVLSELRRRLDADDPQRLPVDWQNKVKAWKERQEPLFVRIHQGLLLSLGIGEWRRFAEALLLLVDDPTFVHEVLEIQAQFAARLADNILSQVEADGIIFSEPIAGNHGALISPAMYREFALASYKPVFDVVEHYRVPAVIWRSYANPRALIPEVARSRFTALWACETGPDAYDYCALRSELGPSLGLIGGIDTDVLRQGKAEIYQAVEAVLPLVKQGRYIPLADGRVREDVPFENYAYYRKVLEELIEGC